MSLNQRKLHSNNKSHLKTHPVLNIANCATHHPVSNGLCSFQKHFRSSRLVAPEGIQHECLESLIPPPWEYKCFSPISNDTKRKKSCLFLVHILFPYWYTENFPQSLDECPNFQLKTLKDIQIKIYESEGENR